MQHPLFATLLLVFTVAEVCNIQNKYRAANKLAKYLFLHKGTHIHKSYRKKIDALHREDFQKHPLFTVFLPSFIVVRFCDISNEYRLSNKLGKFQ